MKKLVLFCLLSAIAVGSMAQKKGLPALVNESFLKKYPNATEVKSKKQKNSFKIKFNNQGVKTTSDFDFDGNWNKSESILKINAIPDIVKKSIEKKYPNGSFNTALLTETSDGKYFYQVTVDTEKLTFDLELDKAGKITKTDKIVKESSQPIKSNDGDNGSDGEQ